jgi:hypothetical protein
MPPTSRLPRNLWATAAALMVSACSGGDLRGDAVPSPDGGTYLVLDDDNGGHCGPMRVDGRDWTNPLRSPARISPGVHEIACGTTIKFTIREGTTFHFKYWGP